MGSACAVRAVLRVHGMPRRGASEGSFSTTPGRSPAAAPSPEEPLENAYLMASKCISGENSLRKVPFPGQGHLDTWVSDQKNEFRLAAGVRALLLARGRRFCSQGGHQTLSRVGSARGGGAWEGEACAPRAVCP